MFSLQKFPKNFPVKTRMCYVSLFSQLLYIRIDDLSSFYFFYRLIFALFDYSLSLYYTRHVNIARNTVSLHMHLLSVINDSIVNVVS